MDLEYYYHIGEECAVPRKPLVKRFRGAVVFTIDKSGFELKGKIDHDDGTDGINLFYGLDFYDTTVKRSLYIDEVLYTFSNKYLKMNNLDDLELVKDLKFEKNKGEDDFEI